MRVDCKASYSGCDYPKSFIWQSNRLTVKHINKEWREPGVKHFLVTTCNGGRFNLAFSETSGSWNIFKVSDLSNP